MLPRIFAAGVSTVSDHRKIRYDYPRKVRCTKGCLRLSDLLRLNLRTCLTLWSVATFHVDFLQPLTLIAPFQLEVSRAQTEIPTLCYVSNGIAGSDGLNVLALETSHVHVNCS